MEKLKVVKNKIVNSTVALRNQDCIFYEVMLQLTSNITLKLKFIRHERVI